MILGFVLILIFPAGGLYKLRKFNFVDLNQSVRIIYAIFKDSPSEEPTLKPKQSEQQHQFSWSDIV
jgi:hypothetical protein